MCSAEGPPGVWAVERTEGGGRNWGGPPRPRVCGLGAAGAYNRANGKSYRAGWASDGVVVAIEGRGQHNRARCEAPLLRSCLICQGGVGAWP
jgi:hypothetical protein